MKNIFIKNFLIVLIANLAGLILSVLMNFVLPVIFQEDVSSYGYVQLYLLYVSYYYIFDLGLSQGIYLKEGGKNYYDLNSGVYNGQFVALTVFEVICVLGITLYSILFVDDSAKKFIFIVVAINILIVNVRTYFSTICQATNRMREYSFTVIINKVLNAVIVIIALIFGIRNFRTIVFILTVGELLTMIYSIYTCRNLVFNKPAPRNIVFSEIKDNVRIGIPLLISGVSSMFITGITRIFIENKWGIDSFAKISLTISISNFFMLFVNAVSVVLYPKLRSVNSAKQLEMYRNMRDILMIILFVGIAFYYPVRLVFEYLLPNYSESIAYAAILIPTCLYSCKMSLLIQTYMKTLRMERQLMTTNIISLVISVLFAFVSVYIIGDITVAVFSILLSQIFRTIFSELILSRYIKIEPFKDISIEFILTCVFVTSNWYIGGVTGAFIYVAFAIIYAILKGKRFLSVHNRG